MCLAAGIFFSRTFSCVFSLREERVGGPGGCGGFVGDGFVCADLTQLDIIRVSY